MILLNEKYSNVVSFDLLNKKIGVMPFSIDKFSLLQKD